MSGPTAYPSMDDTGRFLLKPGRWYGWQMLPGYWDGYSPYCSPIRIERVVPKKSGAGWLDVEFYNAFYAEGVQDFVLSLRVLARGRDYMVATIDGSEENPRVAVINNLSVDWLTKFCPGFIEKNSHERMDSLAKSEMDYYLNMAIFGALRPDSTQA